MTSALRRLLKKLWENLGTKAAKLKTDFAARDLPPPRATIGTLRENIGCEIYRFPNGVVLSKTSILTAPRNLWHFQVTWPLWTMNSFNAKNFFFLPNQSILKKKKKHLKMDGMEWVEKRAAKKKILFGPRVPITAAHVGCRKEKTSSPSSHHAFILILCCFDQTMAAERSTLPTLPHANSRDIKIQSIEMEVWCYSSRHLLCVESCWCETKQPPKKNPKSVSLPKK